MIRSALLSCALCLLILIGCKQAKTKNELLSSIPDPKTLQETYVSNPDKLLSEATVTELNQILAPLDHEGTAHIDVVYVKSIGENVPKDIAHELFRAWKIGSKETNNGLLIFVVQDQKRIEFETGYGLEGILPDMICKRIQEDYMVPNARKGDYDKAIMEGVNAVILRLKNEKPSAATTGSEDIASDAAVPTIPPSVTEIAPDAGIRPGPVQKQIEPVSSRQEKEPVNFGIAGLIISILTLIFYLVFAITLANRLNGYRFKSKWSNPAAWFLVLVPIAFMIYLNLEYPSSWYLIRNPIVLVLFLWAYTNLHFMILSSRLKAALKGKSRHEQYTAWQQSHEPAERIALKIFSFPFLKAYWETYTERQEWLRHSPMNCEKCQAPMVCLDDKKEDAFLSKGQLTEEKIDAIDYDVWECNSCNTHLILDYKNLKSDAKPCPECHFTTLKFTKRKIQKRATTSDSGYGYEYYTCANCAFVETIKFEIAQISTSGSSSSDSSFSSSSSSSSDSSSSSGGDSGGGGSGSSW